MQGMILTIQRCELHLLRLIIHFSRRAYRLLWFAFQRRGQLEHVPSNRGGVIFRAEEVVDHFHRLEEDLVWGYREACPAGDWHERCTRQL